LSSDAAALEAAAFDALSSTAAIATATAVVPTSRLQLPVLAKDAYSEIYWRQFLCVLETYPSQYDSFQNIDYMRRDPKQYKFCPYMSQMNELLDPPLALLCMEYASVQNLVHRLIGGGVVMGTMLKVSLWIDGASVIDENTFRFAMAYRSARHRPPFIQLHADTLVRVHPNSLAPMMNVLADLDEQTKKLLSSSSIRTELSENVRILCRSLRSMMWDESGFLPRDLKALNLLFHQKLGAPENRTRRVIRHDSVLSGDCKLIPFAVAPSRTARTETLTSSEWNNGSARFLVDTSDYSFRYDFLGVDSLEKLLTTRIQTMIDLESSNSFAFPRIAMGQPGVFI